MSLGLLPWERWLPPYVFGPLLCIGSLAILMFSPQLSWWKVLIMLLTTAYGAYGTWVWFKTRRNVFHSGDRAD